MSLPSRTVPFSASAISRADTPLWISMSKRLFAGSGTSFATTFRVFEITQLGAIGTIQPVSGQRVSRQYR
jgi:hypothetical protein